MPFMEPEESEDLTIEEVELTLKELDEQHSHLMQHIGKCVGEASEIAHARGLYTEILRRLDQEEKDSKEADGATQH